MVSSDARNIELESGIWIDGYTCQKREKIVFICMGKKYVQHTNTEPCDFHPGDHSWQIRDVQYLICDSGIYPV